MKNNSFPNIRKIFHPIVSSETKTIYHPSKAKARNGPGCRKMMMMKPQRPNGVQYLNRLKALIGVIAIKTAISWCIFYHNISPCYMSCMYDEHRPFFFTVPFDIGSYIKAALSKWQTMSIFCVLWKMDEVWNSVA
jgi:hypothetical protein